MKQIFWIGILAIVFSANAYADELVYQPVNPAFGGKPSNGNWLLANAQAQDDHDDPDLERREKTAGEVFNETLERLLVRSVASDIVDNLDNPDLVTDQWIDLGDYTVLIQQLDETTLQITTYDEVNDTTTVFTASTDFDI
ncbi:MAG: curli assembly protein CsgF [Gammaproteobacteria bacterium]|nr:curli assembly protein CsgF [Gammaproteobacteria bacterium]